MSGHLGEIFSAFLKLGCTSFGGPVAHLGYFRTEFVDRRKWLSDHAYADLVALCQFLPGPASSQVGMALGLSRGGWAGMFLAWIGFTLPSALLMLAFAWGAAALDQTLGQGVLHGLKLVAVAVVAQAVWAMAQTLTPDRERASVAILAALLLLAAPGVVTQMAVIGLGALFGLLRLEPKTGEAPEPITSPVGRTGSLVLLAAFGLLLLLPLIVPGDGNPLFRLFEIFYRAGALVFGGGHVVLPLLEQALVPAGLITEDRFLAGYGAAQAVPGPLFTFSAFVGASVEPAGYGIAGAAVALLAMFLPSFLLVPATLKFWGTLSAYAPARKALTGVNAAVVGLLLAALYDPVITSGIRGAADAGLALLAFGLLTLWRVPPWAVVVFCAVAGGLLAEL